MKTLLIEDQDLDARMISRIVEKAPMAMEISMRVTNLEDALEQIKKEVFSVILLDMGLPDSHGPQAISRIREINDTSVVVVLTGVDDQDVALQALSYGAQDYIVKSTVDTDMLVRVIHYSQERMHQAIELRESNRELNETLDTLKKAQTKLIRHERLNALGQMASGVAHDFNNALAAIHANVELLLGAPSESMPDEDKREMLLSIRLLTEDASSIANRLGHFYNSPGSEQKHQELNLKHLVSDSIKLTRAHWRDQAQRSGKTISIETNLEDGAIIRGDEAQLREALTNLIFNSVRAIQQEGMIRFSLTYIGDKVLLAVTDNGCGMTEKQKELCFEPFYTSKPHNSGTSKGTGLGLSMVYGIIENHHAQIRVESEAGAGTCFIMEFPRHQETDADHDTSPIPKLPGKGRTARVLLVDDEEPIRKALKLFLSYSGYECEVAEDGQKGMEAFDSLPFDLVVTDRSMPHVNGDKLAAYIKKKSAGTPVIMLTGYGEMMSKSDSDAPAVDLILSKPCKVEILKDRIDSFLE